MKKSVRISRHRSAAPPRLSSLLGESLTDGARIVQRTLDDWSSGVNRFDRRGEGFFLALSPDGVVGACGLNRDPYSADPRLGRLRHLYVATAWRRLGIGGRLVAACLELAAGDFDRVRLRTFEDAASEFYLSLGFVPTGETDATHTIDVRSSGAA